MSETSSGMSITSFAIVCGAPEGITSASLSSAFSITAGFVKQLLKITQNKKINKNKIC